MLYTGILYLNIIYGRVKKKLIYKCIPYNKDEGDVFIPYEIKKYNYEKKNEGLYIIYKYDKENKKNGILEETIGSITNKENYYMYEYYSLGLKRESFSSYIPKDLYIKSIEKNTEEKEIITIDPKGCKDFDDAISYEKKNDMNIITIYIANVPLFLEENNLWKYIGKRYTSIYMPNKNIPMLPKIFSENYCSLKENENRYVFQINFHIKNDKIIFEEYFPSIKKITKNYEYEESDLKSNKMYQKIIDITNKLKPIKDSHELIEYWMIQTNQSLSKKLRKGYKRITQKNETNIPFFEYSGNYVSIKEEGDHYFLGLYSHITSPIRRIVDLLNLTYLQEETMKTENIKICDSFSIEKINEEMNMVKRIHNRISWIELLSSKEREGGRGEIIEKKEENEYVVYFKDFFLVKKFKSCKLYTVGEEYKFKFFYFPMEGEWHRKFRIEPKE